MTTHSLMTQFKKYILCTKYVQHIGLYILQSGITKTDKALAYDLYSGDDNIN